MRRSSFPEDRNPRYEVSVKPTAAHLTGSALPRRERSVCLTAGVRPCRSHCLLVAKRMSLMTSWSIPAFVLTRVSGAHRSRVAAFGCGSSQATTGEVAPRHRWSTLPRCTSDACGAPMGAVGLPGSRKHRASSAAPWVVTERNDRRDAGVGRAATTHSGDATSCSRETVPPRCAPSLASGQLGRYRRRGRCGRIRTRSRGGRESGRVVAEEIA